jgi:hypothetical protein
LIHTPESVDNSSNSIEEADEDLENDSEWGLSKGMELFEVSAKDNTGQFLFFAPTYLQTISTSRHSAAL